MSKHKKIQVNNDGYDVEGDINEGLIKNEKHNNNNDNNDEQKKEKKKTMRDIFVMKKKKMS